MGTSIRRHRAEVLVVVAGLLFVLAYCVAPKPQPSPSSTPQPSASATFIPQPSPTPYECPAADPALVRLPCKVHAERGDGQTVWDCTVKTLGDYMPEGDPHALECQLQAMQGPPNFHLIGATGTLELVRRTNPFQFNLKGSGEGSLICPVGNYDPCRAQVVSR